VVLISVAWMWLGLQLVFDGIGDHNRVEYIGGLAMVFPSSVFVVLVAGVLINRFVPGECERNREYRERKRRFLGNGAVKRQERIVKRLRFLRRHPSAVLAFILVGLVVMSALAFFAPDRPHDEHPIVLHLFFGVFALAYLVFLILFLYAWIANRWESYVDSSIRLTEERLAKARQAKGQPLA
jgi:uncharacterized membrane protein